ncbi:hypothetical protein [Microbulbifer elongatus]|uniref:hypothetical protein n=1 Tax=Microbulbifer elongatus TaxID=86173 RepID=UPI001CFF0A8F|nr:hypothetical protein [Microbulbifer elongatus]
MNNSSAHTKDVRRCLPPWLAVLLLGMFLAVRGLVPAGFMPAPIAGGSPYELCHGDSRSALLLNLANGDSPSDHHQPHYAPAHAHHQGHAHENAHHSMAEPAGTESANPDHQHDSATAQAFSDNHCNFSAPVAFAVGVEPVLWAPLRGPSLPIFTPHSIAIKPRSYLLPPGRAPPIVANLA